MRPDVVVVSTPALNAEAGILEARKPVQIQTVLAELAVEALDERVLRRLAGLNEMQLYAAPLRPRNIAFEVSSGPLSQTIVL